MDTFIFIMVLPSVFFPKYRSIRDLRKLIRNFLIFWDLKKWKYEIILIEGFVICLKFREIFRNFKVIKKKFSKDIYGFCWKGTLFWIWCDFKKKRCFEQYFWMLLERDLFWNLMRIFKNAGWNNTFLASCYFTGHAFELVFDILVHKILKNTFFRFFSIWKKF